MADQPAAPAPTLEDRIAVLTDYINTLDSSAELIGAAIERLEVPAVLEAFDRYRTVGPSLDRRVEELAAVRGNLSATAATMGKLRDRLARQLAEAPA